MVANLFRDLKRKDHFLVQKSRFKWLKEGDTNSRLFHNTINKRRKRNEIVGVHLNDLWYKEVAEVKNGTFSTFQTTIPE